MRRPNSQSEAVRTHVSTGPAPGRGDPGRSTVPLGSTRSIARTTRFQPSVIEGRRPASGRQAARPARAVSPSHPIGYPVASAAETGHVWTFFIVCSYVLCLAYTQVGSEDLPELTRYLPLLVVVTLGLSSLHVRVAARQQGLMADRSIIVPQVLIVTAVLLSTAWFYVRGGTSWTPLFYAIGIPAHMLFQNSIFHVASTKGTKAGLTCAVLIALASVAIFPERDINGYLSGLFRNGNALGIMMCTMLYVLYACWPDRKWVKVAGIAIASWVVLQTSSRSALLFIVAFVLLHLSSANRQLFRLTLAGLFAVVVAYLVSMIALEDLMFDYMFGSKRLFDGASGRGMIWQVSFEEMLRRPIGVGMGNSESVLAPLVFQSASHNALLKMGLEGGWLLPVAYLGLLVAMLRNCRSSVTRVFIIALNLKYVFEIATPFGLSLSSALLTLPYFLENALWRRPSSAS